MPATTTTMSPFGAEITGLRGADLLTVEQTEACQERLREQGVVVYREIDVTDDELVAFSRRLGEVAPARTGEHADPLIATITLDPSRTDAMLAQFRQGNFLWHIDGATDAVPQKGTLLTARQVDPAGGDTEFANTFLAHAALPDEDKARLEGLRVLHSFAAAQQRANPEATDAERAAWQRVPAREHPLVWTRRDGRKSLLLGATAAEVVGLPAQEGDALLRRLLEWCTQPRFTYRHTWRVGDLVIWDNTGMLHRALPFEPTSPRLMHRTTLLGEEAVA